MAADPVDAAELEGQARNAPLLRPRPGHADLVGMQKYDFDEARPVLERASARETAARVALGRVATNFLRQAYGVTLLSHVVELGTVASAAENVPTIDDLAAIDADPVRCFDAETSAAMIAEVEAAQAEGDTLGGVVEVVVRGLPPGLGSHVHWDRRLDARLAAALMGIQAIKGVEVGDGFALARSRGSAAHDEIVPGAGGIARASHRAGGTEGGMSTGEVLRVRAAMKPIATVPRALRTVDVSTGEATRGPPPALRRLCGAGRRRGRRGDGGAGSGRCRRWRSSAAIRWARPAATARPTWPMSPNAACGCTRRERCGPGRRARIREVHGGRTPRPAARDAVHRRGRGDLRTGGQAGGGDLRRRRRGGVPGLRRVDHRRVAGRTRGCWRWAAAPCCRSRRGRRWRVIG